LLSALSFLLLANRLPAAEDLPAISQRAKSLMAEGRFKEAIPLYKQLVAALPGNPGLLLNLGMAEHMAGDERAAIPIFESVLKTQPKLLPALLSLGAARLALREPALAVAPLQKAVDADPANPDARGMLADALNGAGQFDAAAAQYRKLTDLAPTTRASGTASAWPTSRWQPMPSNGSRS